MRIAQVVEPWIAVPPDGYGGIECVVSDLTEALVRRGHDVTLFASGDSRTSAKLSAVYPRALGNNYSIKQNPFTVLAHIYPAFADDGAFDIIHCHAIPQALYFSHFIRTPVVHTVHGTLMPTEQNPDKHALYGSFPDANYISISMAQRSGLPDLHFVANVYNGINVQAFPVGNGSGGYLVWIGRVTPKKGLLEAIETALQVHIPLKIGGFIDEQDKPYFEKVIRPRIDGKNIMFVGELSHADRAVFLGGAIAAVFPIRWTEPFGLVLIESMACGTPVVSLGVGSVPEIVQDGKTGFVVPKTGSLAHDSWDPDIDSIKGLVRAVETIRNMTPDAYAVMRKTCRQSVESTFTIEHMVDGYEAVYHHVLAPKDTLN